MRFKFLAILLLVIPATTFSGKVILKNIPKSSFPISVANFDTITVDDDDGIITQWRVPSSGINLGSTAHGVRINLNNDTLIFDTVGNTGASLIYGIRGTFSNPNSPYDIIINGGGIRTELVAGHGMPIQNRRCLLLNGKDITINGTNLLVDGHNSNVVYMRGSGTNNVKFNGGVWENHSESYSSRETSNSAVFFSDNLGDSGAGYHVWVDGVKVRKAPHSVFLAKGRYRIENCSLWVDGTNIYWDTMGAKWRTYWNDPTKSIPDTANSIGQSYANPYFINGRGARNPSYWLNNVCISGTARGGSRGVLFENNTAQGTNFSDSLVMRGNIMYLHQGVDQEHFENSSAMRAVRIRTEQSYIPYPAMVDNNQFYCYADADTFSTAYTRNIVGLHIGQVANASSFYIIRNNLFKMKALTTGVSATDAVFLSSTPGQGSQYHRILNNKYLTSMVAVGFYDGDNLQAGNDFIIDGDTLGFLDTAGVDNDGVLINAKTFLVGVNRNDGSYPCLNNWAKNCVFIQGASDTNIVFQGPHAAALGLIRTARIYVIGNNALPVAGATFKAKNSYLQWFTGGATTDANGMAELDLTYWREANTTPDSLSYNPFTLWAIKGTDSTGDVKTIKWNDYIDTIYLENTAGSGDTTISVNDTTYLEGDSLFFTASIIPQLTVSTTFNYWTVNNTAFAVNDYDTAFGTTTILANTPYIKIGIKTVEDLVPEATKNFYLYLSGTNNGFFNDSVGVGTIVDDDIAPPVNKGILFKGKHGTKGTIRPK